VARLPNSLYTRVRACRTLTGKAPPCATHATQNGDGRVKRRIRPLFAAVRPPRPSAQTGSLPIKMQICVLIERARNWFRFGAGKQDRARGEIARQGREELGKFAEFLAAGRLALPICKCQPAAPVGTFFLAGIRSVRARFFQVWKIRTKAAVPFGYTCSRHREETENASYLGCFWH
jgi:hypothetical protein